MALHTRDNTERVLTCMRFSNRQQAQIELTLNAPRNGPNTHETFARTATQNTLLHRIAILHNAVTDITSVTRAAKCNGG